MAKKVKKDTRKKSWSNKIFKKRKFSDNIWVLEMKQNRKIMRKRLQKLKKTNLKKNLKKWKKNEGPKSVLRKLSIKEDLLKNIREFKRALKGECL